MRSCGRCGACRTASVRRSCSGSTSTCPPRRPPPRWGSAPAASDPPRTGRLWPWAGCFRSSHEHRRRPGPHGAAGDRRGDQPAQRPAAAAARHPAPRPAAPHPGPVARLAHPAGRRRGGGRGGRRLAGHLRHLPRPQSAHRKVPPYFVTLPPQALIYARTAQVRSTVTGRVLATFSPPRPYRVFTWVSGGADDRTFVLAAQRWWNIASGQAGLPAQNRDNNTPTVFFRMTFDPHSRSAQLTRLTVPGRFHSADLAGMAVSPDGSRLALDFRKSIQIVTLATGATRAWTWPGGGWIGNWKPMGQIFSWSADGRYLEFQQWGGHLDETNHIRILDTTAPGTSLTTARVIVAYPNRYGVGTLATGNSFLTPDGTRIVTATSF